MRIYKIHPLFMCGSHRSGTHNEIHKHLPSLYKKVSIEGRMNPIVQIELYSLQAVHDEVAQYLNHNSPLEIDDYLLWKNYPQHYYKKVDLDYNIKDLCERCPKCKVKIEKALQMKINVVACQLLDKNWIKLWQENIIKTNYQHKQPKLL